MHILESCLFHLGYAVEKKAIKPKETAQMLMHLASISHSYETVIFDNADEDGVRCAEQELAPICEELAKRLNI